MSHSTKPFRQSKSADRSNESADALLPEWAKSAQTAVGRELPARSSSRFLSGKPLSPKPQLLTSDEAAKRLAVSIKTVRRMIADGRLKAVHIGRAVRISEAALGTFIVGKMT